MVRVTSPIRADRTSSPPSSTSAWTRSIPGASEVTVRGTGSVTREFLYVEDAAEAIVLAAERYDGADPVNVGSALEISIKELVGVIAKLTGFSGDVVWDISKPEGQPRRRLDTSRAAVHFGFVARTLLKQGLRHTIAWYRRRRAEVSAAGEELGESRPSSGYR